MAKTIRKPVFAARKKKSLKLKALLFFLRGIFLLLLPLAKLLHSLLTPAKIFLPENIYWKFYILPEVISKVIVKTGSTSKKSKVSKKGRKFFISKLVGFSLTATFIVSFVLGLLFWQFILKDLPNPHELTNRKIEYATRIYDRAGVLLYTIYKDQKRTPISIKDVPPQVKLATIASEDQTFYEHPGFSIRGIVRAIYKDIKEKRLTGGSTITQQLVKNALLSSERTLTRKLREVVLAIAVERIYTKDQILEMYLNEVSYGGTAYGIQEASRTYFDKDAKELTLGESALLAGLPQSPSKYSPFGNNPESAIDRQKDVLRRMEESKFITKEQKEEAEKENVIFSPNTIPIIAPHFVFYVRDYLEEKYGKEIIQEGGLDVTTTLDLKVQTLAEEVISSELEKLKNLNVNNASVVVLNPKTGEILAMVGSKNFFDTKGGGNVNVATRPRQPGSSIKVVNYAYALSNGLTAATIIPDTPTEFIVEGQPPYVPKNYEGNFRGNIPLRSALAESRNIPAVKVLASYGINKMIDLGRKMGITTWIDPKNYGLSLTLGGGEVKLIDLASVFATLSNYGIRPELGSVLKVTDVKGRTLEEFSCKQKNTVDFDQTNSSTNSAKMDSIESCGEQVLDPRVSFIITDILKDNFARSPAFGNNSLLVIKNHPEVAVKTGTSNDLRDNLAVGYTRNYVVAVWIGNNDNSPMSRVASGVTGATPIFNKIMTALLNSDSLSDEPSSNDWPIPKDLVRLPICQRTGTLACVGCPIKMEWFLSENHPSSACSGIPQEVTPGSLNPTGKPRGRFERIIEENFNKILRR